MKIRCCPSYSRRLRLLALFFLLSAFFSAERTASAADALRIAEITIAAPDIIAIEVREPPYQRGKIVELAAPSSQQPGAWIDSDQGRGMVVGPRRDHLRIADTPPAVRLNRAAIDNPAGYGPVGTLRITGVYRKSVPYDSGIYEYYGATRTGASFKHYLYLKLDGKLSPGTYDISWPDNILPPTSFKYDPLSTRAIAIRSTQVGHTAGDLSKTASMSLWLPGGPNDGAVDFRSYGIDRFSIIDNEGKTVFSSAITLRKGPQDAEPGNGVREPLSEYTRVGARQVHISAIEAANPVKVIAADHGFANGDRIALERLGDDQDASATFATVANATSQEFEIVDTSRPVSDDYGGQGFATAAYFASRAGTYVFELDYSAWVPAQPGRYRIAVPGLGVSDAFEIDPDIWFNLGKLSMGGLYNQRSGIALDGRFGYSRPIAFRPGPDMPIRKSRLPLAWSSEFGGTVSSDKGAAEGWITDEKAPADFWGGYMDAGDWDRRIQHVEVASMLLDVFEDMPQSLRDRRIGIPQSSDLLDDPAYKAAGELPDLINEAIWPMDFFRRLQDPDGKIHGGIESASFPLLGEPSFLEHYDVFAYAPDVVSTFKYAAVAARLARTLKEIGKNELSDLYGKSALAAWSAGEKGYADPDAFYADAIAAGEEAGLFQGTPWPAFRDTLQKTASEYRATAAASLFRLTGKAEFGKIFFMAANTGLPIYAHTGDGAWDYLSSKTGDPMLKDRLRNQFVNEAHMVAAAQDNLAYPAMKHPGAPAGWGQGTAPDYNMMQLFMRAYQIKPDDTLLKVMEQTSASILGANQVGISFTTGAGVRQILHPLHEDHRAMGVPAPPGITIYGFGSQDDTALGWVFGPPWSALPEVGTDEDAEARRVFPSRFSLPYLEYLIEHPAVVMQQEYTVQQPIVSTAALWFFIGIQEQKRAEMSGRSSLSP